MFRLDFQIEGMTHQLPWRHGVHSVHSIYHIDYKLGLQGCEDDIEFTELKCYNIYCMILLNLIFFS